MLFRTKRVVYQPLLNTVELLWLEQARTMKTNSIQRWFQPSTVSIYIHLNSRDPSPIYETSVVSVFELLFSFSIFSDHRSLKIENENNSIKIFVLLFSCSIFNLLKNRQDLSQGQDSSPDSALPIT